MADLQQNTHYNKMAKNGTYVNKSSSFKFLPFSGLNKSNKKEEDNNEEVVRIPRVKKNAIKTNSFNYPLTKMDNSG